MSATPETTPAASVPSDAERAAACALAGLSGVGMVAFDLIVGTYGGLRAAVEAGGERLAALPGLHADAAASLRAAGDLVVRGERLLARARELGLQVLVKGEPSYPALLGRAPSPAPVIYVRGRLPTGPAIAVVGARDCDTYGLDRARAVAERLVGNGVTVVSGGARGIDAAAHERTMELGGRTVAVLGLGLDSPDARRHEGFLRRLCDKGAVVTEFALDSGGNPNHFPQRNRTIAGLAQALVVVRGRAGSGALTTVAAMERLNRPIFAVPGNVGVALSHAGNMLLAARRALTTLDGSEALAGIGLKVGDAAAAVPRQPDRPLAPNAARVLGALGPAALHVDEIATNAGLSTSETLGVLLELELGGLCTARPGKYFLRR